VLDKYSTTPTIRDSNRPSTWRRTVYRVLDTAQDNDTASRIVDFCLIALISGSVLAVILESIPAIEKSYSSTLYWFEIVTIAIFSVEYLLRVWSCVERDPNALANPVKARLRFMVSFHAIIDLLAILPFYFLLFGAFGKVDMRFLRAVRLLRVLKLTRYSGSMDMLIVAIRENGRALASAFLILITVMLLAASGMYYFERNSQPVEFGSIPAAMWWAFSTLTTVGYGDVTPITVGGKIFGALITVVGIGMVALPTSILASGYNQQLRLNADRYRDKADEALDDGILTDEELSDLEALRLDLGLGKHTASQIMDSEKVRAALEFAEKGPRCPHCNNPL